MSGCTVITTVPCAKPFAHISTANVENGPAQQVLSLFSDTQMDSEFAQVPSRTWQNGGGGIGASWASCGPQPPPHPTAWKMNELSPAASLAISSLSAVS